MVNRSSNHSHRRLLRVAIRTKEMRTRADRWWIGSELEQKAARIVAWVIPWGSRDPYEIFTETRLGCLEYVSTS